jgi:hypothetical protein
MTIREHFKHRLRVILAAIGGASLLLPLAAVLTPPTDGRESAWGVSLFAIVAAVIIGALIALLRVRCPKCGGSLAHLGSDVTFPIGRSRAERCPHCAISLDAPLPDK